MDALDYVAGVGVVLAAVFAGLGAVFLIVVICCKICGCSDYPILEQERSTEPLLLNSGTFTYNTESETVTLTWKTSRKK